MKLKILILSNNSRPSENYSAIYIQFWQVYTVFVDNLLYRVSHKMISCAVGWESFKKWKLWYASGGH